MIRPSSSSFSSREQVEGRKKTGFRARTSATYPALPIETVNAIKVADIVGH
jgi:hypothetical protein